MVLRISINRNMNYCGISINHLQEGIATVDWANAISLSLAILTAFMVFFLFLQNRTFNRSLRTQSLQQVNMLLFEADKVLMSQPDLIPYLNIDLELPDITTEIGHRARLVVNMYLSAMENAFYQIELMSLRQKKDFLFWATGFIDLQTVKQLTEEFPKFHPIVDSGEMDKMLQKIWPGFRREDYPTVLDGEEGEKILQAWRSQ